MSGRTTDSSEGGYDSLSFLNESDSELLQSIGTALNWPEEPLGFSLNSRWVPELPAQGEWSTSLNYQATDWLSLGVNYRPLTGDASLLANWRVFSEDDGWRPALIVGTSNDDFGDINSDSYYATLSKHFFEVRGVDVSFYGGAAFIEELDELRTVGGVHLRKGAWSALFMHSGVDEHVSISRDLGNHTLTVLLFNLEFPGLAYGFRF